MYKEFDLSYQTEFSTQLSNNECCYMLRTALGSSCLSVVLKIFLDHKSSSHIFFPQSTYVEHLLFINGKKLAND